MSFESDIVDLLNPLVDSQVFWTVIPDGYKTDKPFIILQDIGGREAWYVEMKKPDHNHARIQVNAYAKSKQEVSNLARLIGTTICESEMVAEPFGAFAGSYQDALKLHGSRQDFGFWYPNI